MDANAVLIIVALLLVELCVVPMLLIWRHRAGRDKEPLRTPDPKTGGDE